jgi:hypothetical protein
VSEFTSATACPIGDRDEGGRESFQVLYGFIEFIPSGSGAWREKLEGK